MQGLNCIYLGHCSVDIGTGKEQANAITAFFEVKY